MPVRKHPAPRPLRRRVLLAGLCIGVLLLLGYTIWSYLPYDHTAWTCVYCRTMKSQTTKLGIARTRIYDSEFTPWYRAHFPAHEHVWAWCGSKDTYTASGEPYIFRCGRQHPIWGLHVSIQAEYSRLVPPSELHEVLQAIDSPDRKAAEAAVRRVYERVLDSLNGAPLRPRPSAPLGESRGDVLR